MMQQRLLAVRANAGNVVEQRVGDALRALGTVRSDGEAVRLVAQALQEIKYGVARIEAEGQLAWQEEPLAAGVAIGPFGDRGDGDIGDAELAEDGSRDRQLTGTAIDQDEVGPGAARAFRILL